MEPVHDISIDEVNITLDEEPDVYWVDDGRLYKGNLVTVPKQFIDSTGLPQVHDNTVLTRFPHCSWSLEMIIEIHGLSLPAYLKIERESGAYLGYVKEKEDITDDVLDLYLSAMVESIRENREEPMMLDG